MCDGSASHKTIKLLLTNLTILNEWLTYYIYMTKKSRRIFEKYFQITTSTRELLTLFFTKSNTKQVVKVPLCWSSLHSFQFFFLISFFPLQRNCSREKQVIWSTKLEVILDTVYMSLFNAVHLLCRGAFSTMCSSTWKMSFINGKNLHRTWLNNI